MNARTFSSSSYVSLNLDPSGTTRKARSKTQSAGVEGAKSGVERPYTVFFFGENRELALYRAHVLESMGYVVVIARTKADAVEIVATRPFDAAILSYTLSDDTVKELSDLIRQACPDCPLLTISRSATHDPHVRPDAIVNAEEGPSGLISALRDVLAKRVQ